MLQGRCPKCGSSYYGWALKLHHNQVCEKCGASLEISENLATSDQYSHVQSQIVNRIKRSLVKEISYFNLYGFLYKIRWDRDQHKN